MRREKEQTNTNTMTQSIKLSTDQIRLMSLFQKITKVTAHDCVDDEKQDRLIRRARNDQDTNGCAGGRWCLQMCLQTLIPL